MEDTRNILVFIVVCLLIRQPSKNRIHRASFFCVQLYSYHLLSEIRLCYYFRCMN